MTDRFSPADILNGHFKGLKNRIYTSERPRGAPDWIARTLLYGVPIILGVVMYAVGGTVVGPDGILAAAGILTGALFMAFTQVAAWRERFTERHRERQLSEVHQRDALDEAVAHMLVAMYSAVALIVVVAIGSNFTDEKDRLTCGWAAATAAIGSYLILLILIILPKLYAAYVGINEVDDEMSGLSR